ncbi:hypothetical protein [Novosphingobium sp. Gsoil 351]|uniref:hypothetical protein n=1 Tax=Novosphingobium sp. Gsoil 351 TaxID=2675225 RepID=UPI0012B4B312|nr:hypothetical protein [Novosphingobium sp. Gsoil 351]QGN56205.1 hypothetical protein GKE62_18350 [Novosphingobium sp. Gsoil 351]
MWRPSRRTALEAHVGSVMAASSVYGLVRLCARDARSSLNVSVYDNVFWPGGTVRRAPGGSSTDFETSRNPLDRDLNGCVITRQRGTRLNSALSSVTAATFRARGDRELQPHARPDQRRDRRGLRPAQVRRAGTVLAVANG